jgi:hypothetical protein
MRVDALEEAARAVHAAACAARGAHLLLLYCGSSCFRSFAMCGREDDEKMRQ